MTGDFLSRFSAADRARLEHIGQPMQLRPHQHLIKRGEVSGDIFRVERGQLEVVDSRSRPEVLLSTLGPGDLVGELALIDGTPRSADVTTGLGCELTKWPAEAIQALCEHDEAFAARFWRALAEEISARLKGMNQLARPKAVKSSESVTEDASQLGVAIRDALVSVDKRLRKDPSDDSAREELSQALTVLMQGVSSLSSRRHSGDSARVISREVQPLLLQSRTAELALADGMTGGPEIASHIITGIAKGDGPLGVAIDKWLLALPRCQALRKRHQEALRVVERILLNQGRLHVLLVNTAHGPLLKRALKAQRAGQVVVSEASGAELTGLSGQAELDLRSIDLIVVDSLSEYLPARVAAQSLERLGTLLSPRGRILLTAFEDDQDTAMWTHILGWPAIGRSGESLTAILHAAGFGYVSVLESTGSGLVALAGNPMKNLKPRHSAPVSGIPRRSYHGA